MNKTIVECSILQQPMHIMASPALYYEKDKQQHQRHRQHHNGCQGSIAGNDITESEMLCCSLLALQVKAPPSLLPQSLLLGTRLSQQLHHDFRVLVECRDVCVRDIIH